ncbi:MAG: energy-coupling factor transporter transmembrane protein EcfT, partial [Pseudanabaena sp.]
MKLQTVKYDSLFTRLDFRSKLVVMLSVTILAFLWESPIAGGILTLSVITSCVLAGVRLNYLGTILKVMIPFYIFLILS